MRKFCDTIIKPANNEGGFTIILALILLVLLTIIGTTAINTSTTETMIASSEEVKRTTFYVAESGVQQATAMLQSQFVAANQAEINQAFTFGGAIQPTWNFALTTANPQPAPGSQWIARYNAGVPLITNATLGTGYTYNVRVWNNADNYPLVNFPTYPALPERTDADGLIVVGAIATGPRNTRAATEVVLQGQITNTRSNASYTAQAGAGAGKNYNAADAGAITGANLGALATNASLN